MILVEHAARFDGVETVRRGHRPRHVEQPVNVGAQHLVFGRCRPHAPEPVDLAHRDGVDVLRERCVLDALAQLGELVALALAQLLLDRLHLLAQVVLTLRVGHVLLRLRFDLALHFEERDLPRQRLLDSLELLQQVVLFEQRLFLFRLDVDERRQDVDEPQRIVDVHDDAAQLLRQAGGQRERLFDQVLDAADVRLDLDRPLDGLGHRRDPRAHRRARARDDVGAGARDPLDDDVDAAACLRHLPDDADGADAMQVVRPRVFRLGVLQHEQHEAIGTERAVHAFDRHRTVDRQRLQRHGKRHGAAKRQNREFGGEGRRSRVGHFGSCGRVGAGPRSVSIPSMPSRSLIESRVIY